MLWVYKHVYTVSHTDQVYTVGRENFVCKNKFAKKFWHVLIFVVSLGAQIVQI